MYRRGDEGANKDVILLDLSSATPWCIMYVYPEDLVAVDWK